MMPYGWEYNCRLEETNGSLVPCLQLLSLVGCLAKDRVQLWALCWTCEYGCVFLQWSAGCYTTRLLPVWLRSASSCDLVVRGI